MSLPAVVSPRGVARGPAQLLAREKEATRQRDALNAERRRLPMVRIDAEYVFEGPRGKATLADLFGDRRQLIIQHVMFAPDWDAACPGCTASVDELSDGVLTHLGSRTHAFVLVSRAPLAKLQDYAASRGWTCRGTPPPRAASSTTLRVTLDAEQPEYNYRPGAGRGQGRARRAAGRELLPA